MDDEIYKEVYFNEYCKTCDHEKEDEGDVSSACWECLDEPANLYSHRPVRWKEKS